MRLIDADALIEYICLRQNSDSIPKEDAEAVKHFVEHHAPSVDAVSVVRCKDCIYRDGNITIPVQDGGEIESYTVSKCPCMTFRLGDDFFCAKGKR